MDVLYSPDCIVCAQLIEEVGSYLFGGCFESIDRQPAVGFRRAKYHEAEVVWGAFNGPLREATYALKFCEKSRLGRVLGRHMVRVVGPELAHVDGVIPLPPEPARVRERDTTKASRLPLG